MENTPNSCDRSVTQARPYTPEERGYIVALAEGSATADTLRELFPGRTLGALRKTLSEQRRKMGIPPRRVGANLPTAISPAMLDPSERGYKGEYEERRERDWTRGSQKLLLAIQELRSA